MQLIRCDDKKIIESIFNKVLKLDIKEINYDKNVQLSNISEYKFELIKIKAILVTNDEIEMYLTLVKKSKIKESIFCYWCSIYEEEMIKASKEEKTEIIINKVLISELSKKEYQQSVFLEIENNATKILETGTEVNFLEISEYIKKYKNEKNKYEKLLKYFECNDDTLLIGIKMKKNNGENHIDF